MAGYLKALLATAISALSFQAQAADWKLIGIGDNAIVYVDDASIVMIKGKRKAWTMWSDKEGYVRPAGGNEAPSKSSKVLSYYNCSERTSADVQSTTYSEMVGQGEVVASQKVTLRDSIFYDVTPDTLGETIFEYVCRKKLK